jgi:hypothetical protein
MDSSRTSEGIPIAPSATCMLVRLCLSVCSAQQVLVVDRYVCDVVVVVLLTDIANCFGNGPSLSFINNTCILNYQPDATHEGGYSSDCNLAEGMEVHGNTIATPGGSLLACGTFLDEWVAAGHDKGTKSVQWPADADLVAQGRRTLYSDPTWDGGVKL